jgi:hypothetical protein
MERREFMKFLGGAVPARSERAASGLDSGNYYSDLEAKCEAALE